MPDSSSSSSPAPLHPESAACVASWSARPEVVGIVRLGSRARGFGDATSDDDLHVFVRDEAFSTLAPRETLHLLRREDGSGIVFDLLLQPERDLARLAAEGGDLERWPFAAAEILHDPHGTLAAGIPGISAMPRAFRDARIVHGLVDTRRAVGRARRTLARGHVGPGRLVVASGARALARVAFALEHRWMPADHWLAHDAAALGVGREAVAATLQALEQGDPAPLVAGLDALRPALEAEGFPPVWEHEVLLATFLTLLHPDRAAERMRHQLG